MAVSSDELLTPLPDDGSAVREDLFYLGGLLGLTVPASPSEPGYQLVDMMGRWGTRLWNKWAIPALRAQFGDTAAGDWATLFWRGKGVDRNESTFAGGPVTFENRSGLFHDVSAPGAVQIGNPAGKTFTSQGPPPGSTGTLALWPGSGPYPTTILTVAADEVGTASNTGAATIAGFPATPASAPPGVYVVTSAQPALVGSDGETDGALLKRGRASAASSAFVSPIDKLRAIVLGTKLPSGVAVSTNRIRVTGAAAVTHIWCANPGGPSPGVVNDPTTELGAINARVQLLAGWPGMSLVVAAADLLTLALGTVTIYVDKRANVTSAAAGATATAALVLWGSVIVPIGGFRKAGAQGWIYASEVLDIVQGRVSATYPAQWKGSTFYALGASVSNLGQTFQATAGGTSSSATGPTGNGGPDGGEGLTWAPTTQTGGAAQFEAAPGVFAADAPGFADTMVTPSQVVVFTYTISVVIVDQGS